MEPYNGDFEDGVSQWRFFEIPLENGSSATSTMDAVSGNYAMKINYATDFGDVIDRGFDNWWAGVPVCEDEIYTCKAFVKGDTNSTERLTKVKLIFGFFDMSHKAISQRERSYTLNPSYEEISLATKAPAGAVSCWLAFRLFDATDPCAPFRCMYIDNVRIFKPYTVSAEAYEPVASQEYLLGNFPNPFSNKTTIRYTVDKACSVTLRINDILGQEVAIPVHKQKQSPGTYEVDWIPESLANGIYFYSLEVTTETGTESIINRKMVQER